MNAVTVHDLRELGGRRVLAFDLIDILRLAERDVLDSTWWCGSVVSGADMLRLAAGV